MSVTIKICGLTTADAVTAAIDAGADEVGFVLVSSPRQVTPQQAATLAALVPDGIAKLAVFREHPTAPLDDLLGGFAPDAVQSEPSDGRLPECRLPLRPVVLDGPDVLARIDNLVAAGARTVVLDGPTGQGQGIRVDTERAAAAAKRVRLVLAGGLDPDNVADSIRAIRPAGVDVSGGVESAPGVKDPARVLAFIEAVRETQ